LLHGLVGLSIGAKAKAQGSWDLPFDHLVAPSPQATDHLVPFGGVGNVDIKYYQLGGEVFRWPQKFNAVHMALIPKGPYQGMVFVMNDLPVLVKAAGYGPFPLAHDEYWSCQAYSVIDPSPNPAGPRFRNFLLPIAKVVPVNPASPNDESANLFCSGHAWSPYGDLIVLGGTIWAYSAANLLGPKLTYVWNPDLPVGGWPPVHSPPALYPGGSGVAPGFGLWQRGPDLKEQRWYPTATLTSKLQRLTPSREVMLALGGSNQVFGGVGPNPSWNYYEALRIDARCTPAGSGLSTDVVSGRDVWFGPGSYTAGSANVEEDWFENYPRCHQLSDGRVLFSGYAPRWATLDHDNNPGIWMQQLGQPYSNTPWQHVRHDGASILYPNIGGIRDVVVRLGGADGPYQAGVANSGTTSTVEAWFPGTPPGSPFWLAQTSMPNPQPGTLPDGRYTMNVVTLPDATLLVVGGSARFPYGADQPVNSPLLYNGAWSIVGALPYSPREYHSTAVLLPDGRVFVGGGDTRTADYEVYSPPYLSIPAGQRPQAPYFETSLTYDSDLDSHLVGYGMEVRVACSDLPLGVNLAQVPQFSRP
jgi:hypothetical protein